ncbi:hypothetical protein PVL29_025995 [Vitis rotundifolia]|uniref:Acyl-CoA-binding domain-containing protein n=1 Tax=Vitis rotundifolia TaxID=103349 RepID=A0AA38YLE3_VITRO|nr:hypothetical protein PVL29_025995 [Vitis rotundifolia]
MKLGPKKMRKSIIHQTENQSSKNIHFSYLWVGESKELHTILLLSRGSIEDDHTCCSPSPKVGEILKNHISQIKRKVPKRNSNQKIRFRFLNCFFGNRSGNGNPWKWKTIIFLIWGKQCKTLGKKKKILTRYHFWSIIVFFGTVCLILISPRYSCHLTIKFSHLSEKKRKFTISNRSVFISGHAETLIYDVLKMKWFVIPGPTSSITTNKGFSLVLVQHKEKDFLVAFGGTKKEPSNEVEVLIKEKNEVSMSRRSTLNKGSELFLSENHSSSTGLASQLGNGAPQHPVESVVRQNLASAIEQHGSVRKSLSESSIVDPNPAPGNVSLRKQFHNEKEHNIAVKTLRSLEDECYSSQTGILGQLTAALASREAEMEKKLADTLKEMEMLKEKLAGLELAQEEANSLSNIVHSDNVRLEHDVAFLKAVLDDTQKELHSTRGVLAGERARAFQLQVEVFHLKQRLQSMVNRAPTPRKPFHV